MHRLLLVGAALLALVPVAVAAQTVPNADIAITSNTANVKHAHVGQEVTFTIVATNNGPDAAELDVHVALEGLVLVGETCDMGVFPDMPSCEYGFVQPGQTRVTIAVAQAVDPGAKSAINTACVSSAQPINDPKPGNDCMTSAVKIVGKR
jgi:hypothetical protein